MLIATTACRDLEDKETPSPESMEEYFQKHIKVVALEELTPENLRLKRDLELTPEKLQAHIEKANRVLKRIKEVLESDEANPEEKFEARRAYKGISRQRDCYLKALEKKKSEAECVK